MRMYVCTYVSMYVFTYVHMYVSTYARMNVCMYVFSSNLLKKHSQKKSKNTKKLFIIYGNIN